MASANDEGVALLGELRRHRQPSELLDARATDRLTSDLTPLFAKTENRYSRVRRGSGHASASFSHAAAKHDRLLPGGPQSIQPSADVRFERPVDLPQLDDMERDRWVADCHRQCGSETHAQGC